MSTLVQNVAKVKSAYDALSASIEAKGVSVPAGTKLTGMPALVDQIQTGGGGGEDYGYLTFTAEEATTLTLNQNGGIEPQKLLKSTDGVTWTKWENPSENGISLNAGESVYIKADEDALQRTATGNPYYNYFSSTKKIDCTGDIRSIVKLIVPANYQYWVSSMFKNCSSLTQAPKLPATTLTSNCYQFMFNECTSLTTAPELPATTLATYCYANMFANCTSLTQAPKLPATTLADRCYNSMFRSCTFLTSAPKLPATTLASQCYQRMFQNCTSLTTPPELPATTLADYCYEYMFDGCTSLTKAPELPATTLAYQCYNSMFQNCTSLKRIKMNASSGSWGTYMFGGCTSLELVDMTGSTGVPNLSNVNNFSNTNDTYKIVVPDSLYNTWIAATNWASIASHIMKQSDWNAAHPDDQL